MLTLVRGRHSLKLGFEQSLEKFYHLTDLDNYGRFDFRDSNTGDGYADFLLGLPREIRQDAPVHKTHSGWYTAAFAQDEVRLHSRMMLNFGLRYEIQFPLVDLQNRKNTFVPASFTRGRSA